MTALASRGIDEALGGPGQSRAIAFVTKRGENEMKGSWTPQPYFHENADWQFVLAVLEATMRQKLMPHRSFIMNVTCGTTTLAQVQANVTQKLEKARGFAEGIYTELDAYLKIVVPQIGKLPKVSRLDIRNGLSVMHLEQYSTEMQALIIRSCLEWIHDHERDVVTIIPEAWEFMPQGRGSPVKLAAEKLIRKGAGIGNFMWADAQDLAGMDKLMLRACTVWLLGVQREANEIKRTLDNIPAGTKRPKAADLAMLQRGQFFACWGTHCKKVYVQPAWMTETQAHAVALGKSIGDVRPPVVPIEITKEIDVTESEAAELRAQNKRLEDENIQLRERLSNLELDQAERAAQMLKPAAIPSVSREFEDLYQRMKERLTLEAPQIIKVLTVRPEIVVEIKRETLEADGKSLRGRVAQLLAEGFFKMARTQTAVRSELKRRGSDVNSGNLSNVISQLKADRFLLQEGADYIEVPGMKARIVEK